MTNKVSVSDITALALRLYELDPERDGSIETFKAKFAFAFELLVDAELQLADLPQKLKDVAARNSPRPNRIAPH
jgi:hypothetical protein